ncbi:hypothetical protein BVX95_02370 [archaeon D22]|nr:hypothetical protein BVX95_02370 [archaeon D22]
MSIPKISDKKMNELYSRVKPVVRCAEVRYAGQVNYELHDKGDLYFIEEVDPREVAFTWDPKPKERADGLIELAQINTLHTYGYHGFFKPSVAEVLSQIPQEYLSDVVAFETEYAGFSGSYHAGQTKLYRSSNPQEIREEIEKLDQRRADLEARLG